MKIAKTDYFHFLNILLIKIKMMNLYILPLIAQIGVWGWVVIALAILLLFGGKKIPELMRGTGKGIKEFKKGLNEGLDEDLKEEKKD